MASVSDACDGMAERLATISGLHAYSEWPDTVSTPAAIVMRQRYAPTTFSGRYSLYAQVMVVVAKSSGLRKAFRELDAYVSDTGGDSVIAALEADTTLGGVAEDIDIGGAEWVQWGEVEIGTVAYASVTLRNIEVYLTS
jgi:hypothetical protein